MCSLEAMERDMSEKFQDILLLRLALHDQVSCRKILASIFYLCVKYHARSLSKIAGNIAQEKTFHL